MNRPLLLLLALVTVWQFGCMPYEEEKMTDVRIDLQDPTYRRIYDLQDRQLSDSLYQFFQHKNPTYRYVAALAFASSKDAAGLDSLYLLLSDEVDEVRAAAAYAIGQIGREEAEGPLVEAFDQLDTAGHYRKANRAILEAVGKCASDAFLSALAAISTYQARDTALLEGLAWGLYRYGLRGFHAEAGSRRMLTLATEPAYPASVRLIAANYLFRATGVEIDSLAGAQIAGHIGGEPDSRVRMALAIALGKSRTQPARDTLLALFQRETDYRVQCNILRSLGNFTYADVQAAALQGLRAPNVNVALRSAQYFTEYGIGPDATFYWRTAKDSLAWPVQLELYRAANRHLPAYLADFRNTINAELRQRFRQAASPYEKAAALHSLAEFGWNLRFIQREGFPSPDPVVRTASVEALRYISDLSGFDRFFGLGSRRIREELATFFREAVESGDPGMVAVAAIALRNPERKYREVLDDVSFLSQALERLSLPQEIETYNEVKATLDWFKGTPSTPPRKPDFNHPIAWEVLDPKVVEPTAILRTNRGNIRIKLLPKVAPGSVINFMRLSKDGFYNGKAFHRVVPNFVIQGGCPRGDGYGSLDYSIRSELPPLHYDQEGYVGMASAGNHTEGTQFFITHAPALHLDGNYTIFGRVIDGMDVVHRILQGDVIESVIIQ